MVHNGLSIGALLLLLVAGIPGFSIGTIENTDIASFDTEKIVQTLPDWQQMNTNGFGVPQTNEVSALEVFNGYLYAGTYNPIDLALLFDGAQIFRSADGVTWTPVTQPGFGNSHDIAPPAILDLTSFNGYLYAGTGRGNASQIWRTSNGTTWAPMDVTGFSDPENVDVTVLTQYGSKIYAGVTNQVSGAQIWSSFTGDNNSWTQVGPETPGPDVSGITGFAEYDGALYAAVESDAPAQIWQSFGGPWTTVVSDGFGDPNTLLTGGMAVFGGYLYVGAGNTVSGAQLWRTNDAATWQQIINPGFGDPNNQKVESVFVFQNQLYAGVKNTVSGMEIWRSADGLVWERANQDGFGNSDNSSTNWTNATVGFLNQLYVGTLNDVDGGELWKMLQQNTQTFTDVPPTHPYYQDIEILYANGLTGGCAMAPLRFCPDEAMNRAQSAVFILRGNFGANYTPPASTHTFQDNWIPGAWAEKWADAMYTTNLSAGCSLGSQMLFCPWQQMPREQAVVFALRLKYGNGYAPPPATGTLFADMTNTGYYATKWAEQAYIDGLIPNCGTVAGKPKFCPRDLVSRGLGAYMIVRAKDLSMP
jgi:hypothetical protein